jgi:hypothetical protein
MLAGKKGKIGRAAAYTLADLGDVEPLREHVARNPRRRRLFEPALTGEIPPLVSLWPGDGMA